MAPVTAAASSGTEAGRIGFPVRKLRSSSNKNGEKNESSEVNRLGSSPIPTRVRTPLTSPKKGSPAVRTSSRKASKKAATDSENSDPNQGQILVRETSTGIRVRIKPVVAPVENTPKKGISSKGDTSDVLTSPRTPLLKKIDSLGLASPPPKDDRLPLSSKKSNDLVSLPKKETQSATSSSRKKPSLVEHALHSPRKSPRKEAINNGRSQSPMKKHSAQKSLFDSFSPSKPKDLAPQTTKHPQQPASSPRKNLSLVDRALHSPRKSPRKEAIKSGRDLSPVKRNCAQKSLFGTLSPSKKNDPVMANEAQVPAPSPRKKLPLVDQALHSPRKSPRKEAIKSGRDFSSPAKRNCAPKSLFSTPSKSPAKSPRKESSASKAPAGTPKRLQLYRESSVPKEWLAAKKALQTGQNDVAYVGRDKQRTALKDFLDYNLNMRKKKGKNTGRKRSLYVSGPPGTGKTSLLRQLLAELEEKSGRSFHSAFINCMALKSSNAVFSKIAESFGCDSGGGGKDAQRSVEEFVAGAGRPVLLVLDEIDQLDSKSQQVLYSVYELPHLPNSTLALVGIANALDLTDRILPRLKLRDAVAPGELAFPAYSREEIVQIISSRLEGVSSAEPVIKAGAVRFLAAKISALSGDVRKALDVCRRALELQEVETKKQALLKQGNSGGGGNGFKPIDIPQILKIVNEVYCSSSSSSLKRNNSDLPLQQKIIVASLLLMTSYGVRPVKEVTLGKLSQTYSRVCKKRGMAAVDVGEVASLCTMLEARGFFSARRLGANCSTKDTRLSLRIDEDEVEAALKDKALLSGIIRDVDCIAK